MDMPKKRKRARPLGDAAPATTPIPKVDYRPQVDDTPMNAKQLAEFLGVHPVTIRRKLRTGMPHFRVGNRVRFLPGEVIQWLRKK
jgi:excisionase family DNA binding protein